MQSVERALDLLEALGRAGAAGLPLRLLSAETGLKPPTAHNLLSTLLIRGYVEQDGASGRYALGAAVPVLSRRFLDGSDLVGVAGPALRRLHADLDEWVVFSVLRAGRSHDVISLQSARAVVLNTGGGAGAGRAVGSDPDAGPHCTAVGKVLLSSLGAAELEALLRTRRWPRHTAHTITDPQALRREIDAVRARGYATNREEHYEGLRAVAAPVLDASGRTTAAVGVAYPTLRATAEREAEITAAVRRVAAEISLRLGAPSGSTEAGSPETGSTEAGSTETTEGGQR